MKKLLVLGLGAIAIVVVLTLYTGHLLDTVRDQQAELDQALEETTARLRDLDTRYPAAKPTPQRGAACARVRRAVSDAYQARWSVYERGGLSADRVRNKVLELFATRLESEEMGPTEYRTISMATKNGPQQAPHAHLLEPVIDRLLGEERLTQRRKGAEPNKN